MKTIKLYTEEQLKKALEDVYMGCYSLENVKYIFNKLTPIELPSDEEIEQVALDFAKKYRATTYEISALIIGAKWIRDKIQGGNNEQQ